MQDTLVLQCRFRESINISQGASFVLYVISLDIIAENILLVCLHASCKKRVFESCTMLYQIPSIYIFPKKDKTKNKVLHSHFTWIILCLSLNSICFPTLNYCMHFYMPSKHIEVGLIELILALANVVLSLVIALRGKKLTVMQFIYILAPFFSHTFFLSFLFLFRSTLVPMANQTVRDARAIHGTNPQFIVDKIIRSRIYETIYWKEQCFALTGMFLYWGK